ncbi:DUF4222 domain-containing protein [Klebsiella pneumoniae]|uniref:DUF4222 domain-containing protein n=1 Tax=Klebsiella pneumoniae TaxID=573 RepID=UPI0022747A44|nr:DUF4222 domain-containing protein [Klebsiella pneumoniae]HCD5021503.1 DUF4222 domain-containing protein [Klebsiella pneumoniae]HDE1546809.1 DUF4222 domain-containing protein [Klebsiella quasipneumoniae]HDE2013610.1 DUF4222 domain-containing protein [Klebsiella quasipneumoniae]
MRKKNTGFISGGFTHPEILPGDIYQDKRGERVTVLSATPSRICFIRDGYTGECAFPAVRFLREFTPVKRQTIAEWCDTNNTAEKIKKIRAMIAAKRAGK